MTDKRVCFFGDSLTYGQGDHEGLGWPGSVLSAALREGHNLTAYNLGVRGDTAAQIAVRAKVETDARFRSGEAKAVIFSFGANDLLQERPLEETLEALDALLEWAGAEGYAAFVLPPPTFLEGGPAYRAGIMSDAFADSCLRYGAPFLDTRVAGVNWALWWNEARAGDGVHPGSGGYRSLAEIFAGWTAWRAWLAA